MWGSFFRRGARGVRALSTVGTPSPGEAIGIRDIWQLEGDRLRYRSTEQQILHERFQSFMKRKLAELTTQAPRLYVSRADIPRSHRRTREEENEIRIARMIDDFLEIGLEVSEGPDQQSLVYYDLFRSLRRSDAVMVAATPSYLRLIDQEEGYRDGEFRGYGDPGTLERASVRELALEQEEKFIAVLLSDDEKENLPTWLKGLFTVNLREGSDYYRSVLEVIGKVLRLSQGDKRDFFESWVTLQSDTLASFGKGTNDNKEGQQGEGSQPRTFEYLIENLFDNRAMRFHQPPKVDLRHALAHRRFRQALAQIKTLADQTIMKRPDCFLSYAWPRKGTPHDAFEAAAVFYVLGLAEDLRVAGVEVHLDKWWDKPGREIPRFVKKIREVDVVLPILTELYYEKSGAVSGDGREPYVTAETRIIDHVITYSNERSERVIPVLLEATAAGKLAELLGPKISVLLTEDYFEAVLRLLEGIYKIDPDNMEFRRITDDFRRVAQKLPQRVSTARNRRWLEEQRAKWQRDRDEADVWIDGALDEFLNGPRKGRDQGEMPADEPDFSPSL